MTEEGNGWRPTAGDKIEGTVVDIATGDGGYGPYPIVTLEVEGGSEVSVHAFHHVLRTELARRRPRVGNELAIKYIGKTDDSKDRKGYHTYRVTGGQVQGYDWTRDDPNGPDDDPEPDLPIDTDDLPTPPAPAAAPLDDDSPLPF